MIKIYIKSALFSYRSPPLTKKELIIIVSKDQFSDFLKLFQLVDKLNIKLGIRHFLFNLKKSRKSGIKIYSIFYLNVYFCNK
jgi:hypothetical protein